MKSIFCSIIDYVLMAATHTERLDNMLNSDDISNMDNVNNIYDVHNIAIIITGGTIASAKSDSGDYIGLAGDAGRYRIIEEYKKSYPQAYDTLKPDISNPYTILSENLNGHYLNDLISTVSDKLSSDSYEGIIITHGTDTLQYSAAALSLAFPDIDIPVILVSANYILDDPRSNGLTNFATAIEHIRTSASGGVYVSYDGSILDGFALLPHMPYSDRLYGIGHCDELSGVSQVNQFLDWLFEKNEVQKAIPQFKDIKLSDESPVLYLKATPGQIYPHTLDAGIKAVLLETYHSGTLSTDSASLHSFCKAAHERAIPVYVTGIENRTPYESTSMYETLHLITLPKLSPISAYMYLWFKYSL